jgi:glycosyltransferase involved in cell wall biosynthesis
VKIKPRVLILIATDPIGGPGKGLFQFLKYAPREAFDYTLCNFNVKNRPDGQFIQEARRKNMNLVLLDQRAMIDPRLIIEARRIIFERGINLVQTHGYKSNVIGFFLQTLCRRPWIAFAHGYTDDNWKVRLYNWIDRAVLRYADRIVTVSDSMRALLIRSGVREDKIRLIYNAIESTDARPTTEASEMKKRHGIAAEQKVVGVIGRLSPEKGQLIFLKAMEKVVRSCPNLIALIVGEGQDQAMLQDYCRENRLSDCVVFAGYQKNIGDYYQILDLLVLPSLSEGLPNTVLEAMAFGIPVLATSVGGVPEVIEKEENGILVPPNDPQALADRMIELLRDDILRREIGSKGKSSLHPRFAPDHRVRQIIDLYHNLLSSRSGKIGVGIHA